jgi:flagellar P-ring protein precursor FlgI
MTLIEMGLAVVACCAQSTPAPQPPAPSPRPPDSVVVPIATPPPAAAPNAAPMVPSTATSTTRTIPPVPVTPEPPADEEVKVRVSDLVEIDGARSQQLQGLGIVTGLAGTGDKGAVAKQALANFVKRHDVHVLPADVDVANVALVTVTCRLPPFLAVGTTVSVSVQSINGATSLRGGHLLQTPLYGNTPHTTADAVVVAEGAVAVGGFTAGGKAASVTQNQTTVGEISDGGIVEQEIPARIVSRDGAVLLHLRSPNFTTAMRVAAEIAKSTSLATKALDAASIRVQLPPSRWDDATGFVADLVNLHVVPGDEAVVVVNERTGTVVVGAHVRISTVAITHGNLNISITESEQVSQPNALAGGETAKVDRTDVGVQQEQRGLKVVQGGTNVSQLASSLNQMGVSPADLVAIFQALAQAGALHARLEIR